jgi:plasmid stabilization system protein ParE
MPSSTNWKRNYGPRPVDDLSRHYPATGRAGQEAARWIRDQSQSPAVALRWVRSVRAKIASLSSKPRRCPIDPDSDAYGEEIRVLLHGKRKEKYRVLFTIKGNTVHILTVRHSARRSLAEESEPQDSNEGEAGPVH